MVMLLSRFKFSHRLLHHAESECFFYFISQQQKCTVFAQLYFYLSWNQVLINPEAIENKNKSNQNKKHYYM